MLYIAWPGLGAKCSWRRPMTQCGCGRSTIRAKPSQQSRCAQVRIQSPTPGQPMRAHPLGTTLPAPRLGSLFQRVQPRRPCPALPAVRQGVPRCPPDPQLQQYLNLGAVSCDGRGAEPAERAQVGADGGGNAPCPLPGGPQPRAPTPLVLQPRCDRAGPLWRAAPFCRGTVTMRWRTPSPRPRQGPQPAL